MTEMYKAWTRVASTDLIESQLIWIHYLPPVELASHLHHAKFKNLAEESNYLKSLLLQRKMGIT